MNLALMIVAPPTIFLFIKLNLWSSILPRNGQTTLLGYTNASMMAYQGWVLLVTLATQAMTSHRIGDDIRLGRITASLLYPFDFWRSHASHFLALQGVMFIISSCGFLILWSFGVVQPIPLHNLALGIVISLLASTFWFCMNFTIGIAAFWLEEIWMFRAMISLIGYVASGSIVPLTFFPELAREIIYLSPFPLLSFLPVEAMLGRLENVGSAILLGVCWTVLMALAGAFLWKRGIKLYTAAGL